MDDREVIAIIQKLEREMMRRGRRSTMLDFPEFDDPGAIRKATEASILGCGNEVEICMKGEKRGNRRTDCDTASKIAKQKATAKKPNDPVEEKVDVIIVKPAAGKTFAEVTRALKSQAPTGTEGVAIRGVSKTRNGEILLRIKETKKGAAAAYSDALKGRAEELNAVVRHLHTSATIAIRGLDPTVEEAEIMEALQREGVNEGEKVSISLAELREGWIGPRTAIVRLPKEYGQRLLKKGRLVVGWSGCQARVSQYETEKCCFRCQKFGHLAKECTEEGGAQKQCYRCGSTEHIAKDCKAEVRCYVCGEVGHRADSVRCPHRRQQSGPQETEPQCPGAESSTARRRRRRREQEVENFDDEAPDQERNGDEMMAGQESEAMELQATDGTRPIDEQGKETPINNDQVPPMQPQ